jgi:hypothetical protein
MTLDPQTVPAQRHSVHSIGDAPTRCIFVELKEGSGPDEVHLGPS